VSREAYGLLVGVLSLAVLFSPFPLFFSAVALLSFGMTRELESALGEKGLSPLSPLSFLLFYLSPALALPLVSACALYRGYERWSLESFLKSFFLLFYPPFFLSFLPLVKEEGTSFLLALLLGVWANDIGAYYAGKKLGKRKLFPRLSPNKTLEGFFGGLLAGTLVMTFLLPFHPVRGLFVSLTTLLLAVLGDYFKSFLKRQVGIKDFSNLLGEHGGLVDRFDALTFSAPLFYFWLSH